MSAAPDDDTITPGLLVLHGNRLENLRDAVLAWLALRPLAPLEEEVLLVQSNGAAEWLKMALAASTGICAATRVELPARFLWRSYRQMLGEVPTRSALDKDTLTWRLMRLLPTLAGRPGFEPIAGFLQGDEPERRLQLAERLADLFDQYQVYRADWLDAWEAGHDLLGQPQAPDAHTTDDHPGGVDSNPFTPRRQPGPLAPLPPDQRWQAALWRAVLAELGPEQRAATRPEVHRRFVAALLAGEAPRRALPRRVVLFGAAQVPGQTLEALAALAQCCQVILAIPNPCRFHWADIIEGRDLLRSARQRHAQRGQIALHQVAFEAMHQHAHPLLAAWGRQGRDFMRQLDAFDDAEATRRRFALPGGEMPRIDLFDHEQDDARDALASPTLLQQLQRAVRDLRPLAEHPRAEVALDDRSITFHIAHSAQREVEILHDRLLQLLAHPPAAADDAQGQVTPLEPRDIVVMVPDVEVFAPAIRAVFGQVGREDARFIPFEIADLRQRGNNPLVLAMEWLLRAPTQRFRLAELRDLLDVPALARRFGLAADDLPRLAAWMDGAGIRWGLHAEQRAGLGLETCGEQNSALFGLRRLLLGYASGATGAFAGADGQDIWPHDEVGGLEAGVVGALADLVDALSHWWQQASTSATPQVWAEKGRALLDTLFDPTDERERLTLAGLRSALNGWLDACETANFVDEAVPVEVLREAWLAGIDAPGSGRRFLAGGVTFCTLMPLRAVPFEVVCLLGMNDGDYPRATRRSDFDLLGLPGQARPGDRSRRDDDRYLMLEALLSARRVLHISWAGRSLRDNSEQPPSVLVAQLRDYLGAGWRAAGHPGDIEPTPAASRRLLHQLDTEHPLQPFSRRYFEATNAETAAGADRPLFTYAREWRAAHQGDVAVNATVDATGRVTGRVTAGATETSAAASLPPFETSEVPIKVDQLVRFLKNPVKEFFRTRLHVIHRDDDPAVDDDEAFALAGLADWQVLDELVADPQGGAAKAGQDVARVVQARLAMVAGSGRLPMAGLGQRVADELQRTAEPMLAQWQALHAQYERAAAQQPLVAEHAGVRLQDWLDGLLSDGHETVWISSTASRLMTRPNAAGERHPRPDKLLDTWVRLLAAGACGIDAQAILLGRDACLQLAPLPRGQAAAALAELLAVWRDGMQQPLPLPCRTGLAAADGDDPENVYEGSSFSNMPPECEEACLARTYPDFEALVRQQRGPDGDSARPPAGDGDEPDPLADSLFLDLALRIYGPLLHWADKYHRVRPWAGADTDSDDDEQAPAAGGRRED